MAEVFLPAKKQINLLEMVKEIQQRLMDLICWSAALGLMISSTDLVFGPTSTAGLLQWILLPYQKDTLKKSTNMSRYYPPQKKSVSW